MLDDVDESPESITVGQFAASVASLPNSTSVTVEVTITQNWEVEFDGTGTDTGGDTAFDRLLNACKAKYPSCTGTIVSSTARLRRALGGSQTASFTRVLSNNSDLITTTPQLEANNVTVQGSTFITATTDFSVTALGGPDEASALTDGSLSPDAVALVVTSDLGLNLDILTVSEPESIFPPMPPPSLPPSSTPSPPLPSPPPPSPSPSPSPPLPSPPPPLPRARRRRTFRPPSPGGGGAALPALAPALVPAPPPRPSPASSLA